MSKSFNEKTNCELAIAAHSAQASLFLKAERKRERDDTEMANPKRRRYRTKTVELGLAIHAQLGVAANCGLHDFDITKLLADPTIDPINYPELGPCSDRGPDAVALSMFLGYNEENIYNVLFRWDLSHDCKACLKGATKDVGLWPHQCLHAIAARTAFGPFNSGLRRNQVRESVSDHLEHHSPHNSVEFQAVLPLMLIDEGTPERIHEIGIRETKWEELKEDSVWVIQGDQLNLERFAAAVYHQRQQD